MKKSTIISSKESTINNEDRIINRDLIDPYKYEKKLLKVYDYESNKNKYNLDLNSITVENSNSMKLPNKSIEGQEEMLKSNYAKEGINKHTEKQYDNNKFNNIENSGIQSFNRIKDYMEKEKINAAAENTNFNPAENLNNTNNNNRRNLNQNEEFKNPVNNSKLNDYNYHNHLKVFNSLSNFSDSNDKTFNLNDSKLTFNSRIDNSLNLNNKHNLTNLNNSNLLNANLHTYDEYLNKYKRKYLNTTDSRESSGNKNTNERNNSNFISNNINKNNFGSGIEKINYIKINESTEIPPLNKNEDNRNIPNKNINLPQARNLNDFDKTNNHKEIALSSNLMGIDTTKLHKTIEKDMKEYNNMSKIIKDQIGNYNNKLDQISQNISNNLNLNIERNNIPIGENINRKDSSKDNYKKHHENLHIGNIHNMNNSREYSSDNINNFSERNNKNKDDFSSNNDMKTYSTSKEFLNNRHHSNEYNYLNKAALRGAYEKYNIEAYKNQNQNRNSPLDNSNKKNKDGLNYDYGNNKLTINTLENTNHNINPEDNRSHKIDDLERNIYQLKNRIETNLKNRENMLEKFKEDKSNHLMNINNNDNSNKNAKLKAEFNLLNKTVESNLINLETEKNLNIYNYNDTTAQQMNFLNDSTEENKNNFISNYLEKYKENLDQVKSKNDPKSVLSDQKIWQHQQQIKIEKLKEKPIEILGTEEHLESQKNERRKVLDMIKDCKKEIEFYKHKISQDNQDFNCFPDLRDNKNKYQLDIKSNINNPLNQNQNSNNNNNYKNNEIKLNEGHHKTNFTLGREQDFNHNNNNSTGNLNLNTFKRPNSKSADRYTDSGKKNDQSINETYLTNNKKNPKNNNDYSSNINITLESVSNKSAVGNINDSKLTNNNKNKVYKLNTRSQVSTNKSGITSKSKVGSEKSNIQKNPSPNKNTRGDKSPIKILNTISSSKTGNTPIRNMTDSNSKNKITQAKQTIITKNEIKRSNTINNKNKIPSNTSTNLNNTRDKSTSKIKTKNLDNNSNIKHNTNTTYLSSIPNTMKVVTWDKFGNLDELSSLDENLEQVQKQKRNILLQENEILKEKIKHLEGKIEQLCKSNENLVADRNQNLFNNNKNFDHDPKENNLIMELQIWKNRSEKMTENYIHTLNDLKNQLKQDRKHYVDLIRNMQGEFHSEVDRLKKAYEGNILKNEKIIKKLKKENEDISKKLGKVKDIIALSQNKDNNKKK